MKVTKREKIINRERSDKNKNYSIHFFRNHEC